MKEISYGEFEDLRNNFNEEFLSKFRNKSYLYLFDVLLTDKETESNNPEIYVKFDGLHRYIPVMDFDEILELFQEISDFCNSWNDQLKNIKIV